MALEDDIIGEENADNLVRWEDYAASEVNRLFGEAHNANGGANPAALRQSQNSVSAMMRRIAAQVFAVGTAIASSAWRLITGRRPIVRRRGLPPRVEAPPTTGSTFDQNLDSIINSAVERMVETPDESETIYQEANESTQQLSRTEVNREAARAAEVAARALGAQGVVWVSERDACVHCTGLAGEAVPFGQPFPAESPFAEKQLTWQGYNGRPPRHPNCRCRLIPWDGTAETTEALRREAERSIARGWSLPTESNAQRLRALDRLLRMSGSRLPPSVLRRARQALAGRNFPQGRNFPG